jgi:hypothetical protein
MPLPPRRKFGRPCWVGSDGAGCCSCYSQSDFTAFQSRDNTRLIASTQVHAFNGEDQRRALVNAYRFKQHRPIRLVCKRELRRRAQVSPTGGFPVINYEPTGLTLKLRRRCFPNLDVQVKMNIESKDVLGASTLTPHVY